MNLEGASRPATPPLTTRNLEGPDDSLHRPPHPAHDPGPDRGRDPRLRDGPPAARLAMCGDPRRAHLTRSVRRLRPRPRLRPADPRAVRRLRRRPAPGRPRNLDQGVAAGHRHAHLAPADDHRAGLLCAPDRDPGRRPVGDHLGSQAQLEHRRRDDGRRQPRGVDPDLRPRPDHDLHLRDPAEGQPARPAARRPAHAGPRSDAAGDRLGPPEPERTAARARSTSSRTSTP